MPSNYTPLQTLWPTLTGTTDEKIAEVNATSVAGPNINITVESVVGYLLLNGIYPTLQAFSKGTVGDPQALQAAKILMAWLTVPNAPILELSNPTVYAHVAGMASVLVAQETATPGSTGFSQPVMDGLLALAATTVPWWTVNGLTSPINEADLEVAGGLV